MGSTLFPTTPIPLQIVLTLPEFLLLTYGESTMSIPFPLMTARAPARHRLIIVEGPQGSGKTSLVNSLCRSLPMALALKKTPMAYKTQSPGFLAMGAALADLNLLTKAQSLLKSNEDLTVVLDRAFLSNVVYTLLRERKDYQGRVERYMVRNMLRHTGLLDLLESALEDRGSLVVVNPPLSPGQPRLGKNEHWLDWSGQDVPIYKMLSAELESHFLGTPIFVPFDPGFVENPITDLANLFETAKRAKEEVCCEE